MIHIAITAGGTIEDIDEVRKITNTSTGRLGIELCNELLEYMANEQSNETYTLHYIATQTAIKPSNHRNICLYEVTDTQSVLDKVRALSQAYEMDYFIHSMAISDFTTEAILSQDQMALEIRDALVKTPQDQWLSRIKEILKAPQITMDQTKKITSQSDVVLSLKRTPKVISEIKKLNPKVYLVGFKLLKNVAEEELVRAANVLAEQNGCDLVLANDLDTVQKGAHLGLLVKDHDVIGRYEGKKAIARAIIHEMFKRSC